MKEEGGDEPPAHELPAHELVNGGKGGGLGASSKSGVVKREMPAWLETGDIV